MVDSLRNNATADKNLGMVENSRDPVNGNIDSLGSRHRHTLLLVESFDDNRMDQHRKRLDL